MSTEYPVFKRIVDEIELYEHSSRVDLTVNSEPILSDMTGEEMMQLAAKLVTVAEYVHGQEFVADCVSSGREWPMFIASVVNSTGE